MDRQNKRSFFVVTVASMFCWFNASIVSAQTATNVECSWCIGRGEIGWNAVPWSALDPLVRQNLQAQQDDINALKQASAAPGIPVVVDNVTVGGLLHIGPPVVEVNLTAGGTSLVSEAVGGFSGSLVTVMSPLGYLFRMSGSTTDNPPLSVEGQIRRSALLFSQSNCSGSRYIPVGGNTGKFSNFIEGDGEFRPWARWVARQGFVFASPDPGDVNPAYFVRRNAAVSTVTIQSLQFTDINTGLVGCFNFSVAGWDLDPLLADHTVVPVEVNDSAVTGVAGILGGDISLGF